MKKSAKVLFSLVWLQQIFLLVTRIFFYNERMSTIRRLTLLKSVFFFLILHHIYFLFNLRYALNIRFLYFAEYLCGKYFAIPLNVCGCYVEIVYYVDRILLSKENGVFTAKVGELSPVAKGISSVRKTWIWQSNAIRPPPWRLLRWNHCNPVAANARRQSLRFFVISHCRFFHVTTTKGLSSLKIICNALSSSTKVAK